MFRIRNAAGIYYVQEMSFHANIGNPATYVSRKNAEKKIRSMRHNIAIQLGRLKAFTESGAYDHSASIPRWEKMLSDWNGAEVVELVVTEVGY
jgi:hypothetical protein